MQKLIKNIEDSLFNAKDSVCLERAGLATEGYNLYADQQVPLKWAMTFRYILKI